ncbi:MAG: HAD-IA family hydrolase [Candidatus Omnitrophota bacterium]|nr:HAD-IA family hydrolase [Candidatus Omnitrophota bacterium]
MIKIDAIFFDVDGTLIDARTDIANAVNYTLKKLGINERTKKTITSYIGTGVKDLIAKSLGSENTGLADDAIKIFSAYYIEHSADEAILYPHVDETLKFFKDKHKYILTNRYARFADITLRKLGIRNYFMDIIGGDDENCLKPSACVFDSVRPKLKIDKNKAIIVGDMAIDILTGKNSGIKTCWVTYGLGKAEEVRPLRPDYIVNDMIELKGIMR